MELSLEEMKDLSLSAPRFPRLPPLPAAPSGATMRLTTNLFRIHLKTSNYIYIYSVDFKESIPSDNTVLRKKYIREAKLLMTERFKRYIFTGSNLFSTHDAGDEVIEIPTPEPQVKAMFKKAHVISLNDLKDPNMNSKDPKKMQTCVYFLNIIIKMLLNSLKMVPIGRTGKYLIIEEANLIEDCGLSVVPGYKTSVRLCDSGPLLEIDYTSRIFSKTPAYWILKELEQEPNYKKKALEEFKGRSVITWYGNKRSYIIDDIDFELNPDTHRFPTPEGLMSITEYMHKKYKITVRERNQPLLVHIRRRRDRPEEKVYLLPELCAVAGLSEKVAESRDAMKQISVYTKLNPDARMKKTERILNLFSGQEETKREETKSDGPREICEQWGLVIDHVPVKVVARRAPPVKIKLGNREVQEVTGNGQFTIRQKIVNPLHINRWLLVYDERKEGLIREFVDTLYHAAKTFEIEVEHPKYAPIQATNREEYKNAIEKCLGESGMPSIVVCIFSAHFQNVECYSEIKRWAITHNPPIITQIIVDSTLHKKKALLGICSKIVLQMNAKMGGEIWQLESIPMVPRRTMIVGIDVSRDKGFTCLGVSSTRDPLFSSYYTQVWKLPEGAEIAGTVSILVITAIITFFEATKGRFYPELIVIYRDGVGESQKAEMFEVEVNSILIKIKERFPNENFKIIFAVVNKKQHTRFFQNLSDFPERHAARGGRRGYSEVDTGSFMNPSPGTIIHSDIIDSNSYEFLMMPQFVNEGSGTPVRVHVIYDSSQMPLTVFEDLTNSLCYGYDNWQGPIRTPAPCKYAYTCAKLISRYTKCKPNQELSLRKYFL